MLHDCNAFTHVICTVALYSSALALGECAGFDNLQFIIKEIVICLYIGKAINPGDNISSVLAEAIQNYA